MALLALAYPTGCVPLLGRRRLPEIAIDVGLAIGIAIVALAIHDLGDRSEHYLSLLYVWSSLNAAFVLARWRAAIQLALIGAASATGVGPHEAGAGTEIQTWLITVGTASLAMGLVGLLKGRVERLIEEIAGTARS